MNNIEETRQKILVVEDEEINRKLLYELLKREGDVLLAPSGKAALSMAEREQPDLILLDIFMPEMDGYEVLQALRANPATQEIAVIIISAHSAPTDEENGLKAGAIDFIGKPFRPTVVHHKVRNILQLLYYRKAYRDLQLTDDVTGLGSRRKLEEEIESQWNIVKRRIESLAVGVVEIDHFEAYQLQHGLAETEELLRKVADVLKASLRRPDDILARPGGGRFVFIVPQARLEGMEQITNAAQEAMNLLAIPHESSPDADHVTMSIGGVVGWPSAGDDPTSLLIQASDIVDQVRRSQGAGHSLWSRELDWAERAAQDTA